MKRKRETSRCHRKGLERRHRKRLAREWATRTHLLREQAPPELCVLLTGQATIPIEIRELGRIVSDVNASLPPVVEWTSA